MTWMSFLLMLFVLLFQRFVFQLFQDYAWFIQDYGYSCDGSLKQNTCQLLPTVGLLIYSCHHRLHTLLIRTYGVSICHSWTLNRTPGTYKQKQIKTFFFWWSVLSPIPNGKLYKETNLQTQTWKGQLVFRVKLGDTQDSLSDHTHSWQPAGSPVHFKASDSALYRSLTPQFQTLDMKRRRRLMQESNAGI